jgi:hypothetical protein
LILESQDDLTILSSDEETVDFLEAREPPLVSVIRHRWARCIVEEAVRTTRPREALATAVAQMNVRTIHHWPQLRRVNLHPPVSDLSAAAMKSRSQALELLRLLCSSGERVLQELAEEIMHGDETGFLRVLIDGGVDVVTHGSADRLDALKRMLGSVPVGVRIVCAVNGTSEGMIAPLRAEIASGRLVLADTPESLPYPFNALRNRALRLARARYVMVVDIDFLFLSDFWFLLLAGNRAVLEDGGWICPLALTHDPGHADATSTTMTSQSLGLGTGLSTSVEVRALPQFRHHSRWHPRGRAGPEASLIEITERLRMLRHTPTPAEPWGLVRRDRCALADEDFVGRGGDKQQLVAAMIDRGVRFFASTTATMVHIDHPRTAQPMVRRPSSFTIWRRRYRWMGHRYLLLSNGHDMVGTHLSAHILDALDRILENRRRALRWALADSPAVCLRSMAQDIAVIVSSTPYMSDYAGRGYRVISVVRDPRVVVQHAHEAGKSETIGDNRLVRCFAEGRPDVLAAAVNADAMTLVVDTDHLPLAERQLTSILGTEVGPIALCVGGESTKMSVEESAIPHDVALYNKLGQWFGFGSTAGLA